MKAILICPDERMSIAGVAEWAPLANVSILGKTLLQHWLEHLAAQGKKEILVIASDRAAEVSALVKDGSRWGLRITVEAEESELSPEKAFAKYQVGNSGLDQRNVMLMDHLPQLPEAPLLTSYDNWFQAVRLLMPEALTPDRIGVQELQPGVWAGLHTQLAPDVKLIGPCWLGERVWIESGATIGPNAILEKEVFVSRGAEISESIVGPETFVGQFTEVRHSIAWGSTLINWKRDSFLNVPDEFLLCSLEPQRPRVSAAKAAVNNPTTGAPMTARFREFLGELVSSVFAEAGPPR